MYGELSDSSNPVRLGDGESVKTEKLELKRREDESVPDGI